MRYACVARALPPQMARLSLPIVETVQAGKEMPASVVHRILHHAATPTRNVICLCIIFLMRRPSYAQLDPVCIRTHLTPPPHMTAYGKSMLWPYALRYFLARRLGRHLACLILHDYGAAMHPTAIIIKHHKATPVMNPSAALTLTTYTLADEVYPRDAPGLFILDQLDASHDSRNLNGRHLNYCGCNERATHSFCTVCHIGVCDMHTWAGCMCNICPPNAAYTELRAVLTGRFMEDLLPERFRARYGLAPDGAFTDAHVQAILRVHPPLRLAPMPNSWRVRSLTPASAL